jgi:hypothetical protein
VTGYSGPGPVCLVDQREPVVYGNDGSEAADVWWFCFGGRHVPHWLARLSTDQEPVFARTDRPRFRERVLRQVRRTR